MHATLKQLLMALLEAHLVRLLHVASSLHVLDVATFAIQVRSS